MIDYVFKIKTFYYYLSALLKIKLNIRLLFLNYNIFYFINIITKGSGHYIYNISKRNLASTR